MKQIPLLLLGAMALVFIWAQWLAPVQAWVGYVKSFAEAAMIGALADWFAVVALFRHPLGLPIPHTAIIPQRKNEIGESLGRFVADNFLTPDAVAQQLTGRPAAAALCRWSILHADGLADAVLRMLSWLASAFQEPAYREFFARNVLARIEQLPTAGAAGRLLDLMARNSHHQSLFSELLRTLVGFLEDHKDSVREHMRRGSPWWIPEFVDQRIYDQMIDRVQQQLLALVLDPEHDLRAKFDATFRDMADALMDPESMRAKRFEAVKSELLGDSTVRAYSEELWAELATLVGTALDNNRAASHAFFSDLVRRMAEDALKDPALLETFDEWLRTAARFLVTELGHEASGLITTTVRAWDPQETAQRIETQIGSDLQFIRINGTLVGGLVGLVIHTIVHLTS